MSTLPKLTHHNHRIPERFCAQGGSFESLLDIWAFNSLQPVAQRKGAAPGQTVFLLYLTLTTHFCIV